MKAAAPALALALASCNIATVLPADPAGRFDPIAFFEGRTRGEGTLQLVLAPDRRMTVDGLGRRDGRGGLVLDQAIREGDKAPRLRRWVIHPVGPNRFTGALTDAAGPVEMIVAGPRATIRYRTRGGLAVEQRLALQTGGRTLVNELTVRRLGVRVARLDEVIRKLD